MPASGPALSARAIEDALERALGAPAQLVSAEPLTADRAETELKHIGYGEPVLLRYRAGGEEGRLVLRTMAPNWFGHDRRADRASLALLAADTFAGIPDHLRALDVGWIGEDGRLVSLAGAGEFYLLTTYVDGDLYAHDLRDVEARGSASQTDRHRARALATWLAALHARPLQGPRELYVRAIRDLLGSGEGIFGICDGYPEGGPIPAARLEGIERRCLAWRWRLRGRAHRLRRTHGDFHPYNVLFRKGDDFSVVDASRGCAGDPADDIAAMSINYVLGGVLAPKSWPRGTKVLWDTFWSTYLAATGDDELLDVVAPFLAWRALVVASPVWYPDVPLLARDAILSFAESALDARRFDPAAASEFVA